jgi:hypothetical protein
VEVQLLAFLTSALAGGDKDNFILLVKNKLLLANNIDM